MGNLVKIISFVVVISIISSIELSGQTDSLLLYPARNLIFPKIKVEIVKKSGEYSFNYTLENVQGASQRIHRFMIELNASVKPISAPFDWTFWDRNYDTIDIAVWFSADSIADIDAGEVVSDFGIKSAGLPSINRCWFRAWETVKGEEGQYDPATASIFMTSLQKSTIGPSTPPIPFMHLAFLDTLLSYSRQSVQLGWLKEKRDDDCDEDEQPHDGVAKNIEKRIEKAKRELIQGDSAKARKELEKLVKKVEKIYEKSEKTEKKKRESEITMSSEAYALLKYNTEYLIERLPEKGRK